MTRDLKLRIARNTAISLGGKMFAGALGLLSIVFMTRALGPDGFGVYNTVFAFLYIFSVFGDFGLSSFLAREIAKPGANERDVVSHIFFTRLILVLCSFAAAFLFLLITPYSPETKQGVFIAALGFLFLSLSGVLMGVYQKHLKTIVPAVADAAARTVQLAAVVYLYLSGGSVADFLWVFVAGSALHFSIMCAYAKKYTKFIFSPSVSVVSRVVRESWPLALAAALILIYFKGDTLLLSFLKPQHDVGVYSVAYKVLENLIIFPAMFAGLVMPLLSRYFIESGERFRLVFQKTLDVLVIAALPLAFGGIYCADAIIAIMAGVGFAEAVLPLQVLFVAMVFIFLGTLFGNAVIACNRQKTVLWVYGAAALFNLTANLYFIERYSYLGAATVTAATELLVSAGMLFIVYRAVRFLPRATVFWKALAASLTMTLALFASPAQNILALFVVGTAVYGAALFALGGASASDLRVIRDLLRRPAQNHITL